MSDASDTPARRLFARAGYTGWGARFSDCGAYRYALTRTWDADGERIAFVGLNPSTADATQDDPTIRRIVSFARDWGFGGVDMLNLFAFRATDPRDMKAAPDPVGPANDRVLLDVTRRSAVTVAAWGVHGAHRDREAAIAGALGPLWCLGTTRAGHPRHPLYLRRDTPRRPWRSPPAPLH